MAASKEEGAGAEEVLAVLEEARKECDALYQSQDDVIEEQKRTIARLGEQLRLEREAHLREVALLRKRAQLVALFHSKQLRFLRSLCVDRKAH